MVYLHITSKTNIKYNQKMSTQKIISDFKNSLQQKYGSHFFWQQKNNHIILMTEKLTQELRRLLFSSNYTVSSLENNDKLGQLYQPTTTINLFNHPQSEEIKRIKGGNAVLDTTNPITTMTNEISPEDLVRGYQPNPNSNWMAVVVLHDYDNLVPKAIGWTNQLDKLKLINKTSPPNKINLVSAIKKFLDTPYRRGGKSEKGIDCSAFTQIIIYKTTGIRLPRQSAWQAEITEKIDPKDARPGDLIFFSKENKIFHAGIIYGKKDNTLQIVHSNERLKKVTIHTIEEILSENNNIKLHSIRRLTTI